MTNDPYLHDTTKRLVEAYLKHPSQGLLLTGKSGTGLGTLAHWLAMQIVSHSTDIATVTPDEKGTIPIERVRTLYVETRAARKSRQAVVIDDIDAMSNDAQNAFLKLLEEPNDTVCFILTSHEPEHLLQTILSRVERQEVQPISAVESQSLLRTLRVTDPTKIQQMLFIANGLPAELSRLAGDAAYFEERASVVRLARDFLSGTLYEKLAIIGRITSRQDAQTFIAVLANLIDVMGKKDAALLQGSTIQHLERTAARLAGNGHVRTQLADLALSI